MNRLAMVAAERAPDSRRLTYLFAPLIAVAPSAFAVAVLSADGFFSEAFGASRFSGFAIKYSFGRLYDLPATLTAPTIAAHPDSWIEPPCRTRHDRDEARPQARRGPYKRGRPMFRSDFSDDAWTGFAQMFAAAHGMVSKADGYVDDQETNILFSVVQGEYAAAPADVLDAFDADPALAHEILADKSAIVHAIAPSDGGAAALRAKAYLADWIAASPSDDVREFRARLLRGLLVEVMYLGLRAGAADGAFDSAEYQTWMQVGTAFGLPDEWMDRLRVVATA
jgi:hypothetical protein